MKSDDAHHWSNQLTEEQRAQLRWLHDHRCAVEVARAASDPLHDLPAGYVIEVLVNKHGVVKVRTTDISQAFSQVFESVKALFDFVDSYDPGWRGSEGL